MRNSKRSQYCFPRGMPDFILDNVPYETYLSGPQRLEIIKFRLPLFYQEAKDAINMFLFHRAYNPLVESWMFYSRYLGENTHHKNVSLLIFGVFCFALIIVLAIKLQCVYCLNCSFQLIHNVQEMQQFYRVRSKLGYTTQS